MYKKISCSVDLAGLPGPPVPRLNFLHDPLDASGGVTDCVGVERRRQVPDSSNDWCLPNRARSVVVIGRPTAPYGTSSRRTARRQPRSPAGTAADPARVRHGARHGRRRCFCPPSPPARGPPACPDQSRCLARGHTCGNGRRQAAAGCTRTPYSRSWWPRTSRRADEQTRSSMHIQLTETIEVGSPCVAITDWVGTDLLVVLLPREFLSLSLVCSRLFLEHGRDIDCDLFNF